MKAIQFSQYGAPDVLTIHEIEKPSLKTGQILVQIKAFGINPIDWKLRRGDMQAFFPLTLPHTLGAEFAGIVVEVADKDAGFKVGDHVYGRAQHSYAEYVAVDTASVNIIPDFLDFVQAASLSSGSQVAYSALKTVGNIQSGQKVLIHAGAGGVGIAAIQIAKHFGAHVTTTVSAKNTQLVKELGADEVIDYQHADLRKNSEKYDLILDSIGGQTQIDSWTLLNDHGTLVSLVSDEHHKFAEHLATQNFFFMRGVQQNPTQAVHQLISELKIKPVIDRIYHFTEIAEAHERSQAGHVSGKIVVTV